jgi:ATP-dependent DNA helicase DinG
MKFAVIDFETTGAQPDDEIIQVGLVLVEDGRITDQMSSFVQPKLKTIPEPIRQLTGISDDMLKGAPLIDEVIGRMLPFLHDAVLVAHNASFDLAFLQRALDQCGYAPFAGRVIDTLDLLRIAHPGLASYQLSMVSSLLELDHDQPHRADSDALVTARVLLICLDRLRQLPLITLQRIVHLMDNGLRSLDDLLWLFRELLAEKEQSVVLDPERHRYYRQFALNVDEWHEDVPARELREEQQLTLDPSFESFYEQLKDHLKSVYERYENRKAQEEMIRRIMEAFESGKHLLVEAGTGTGKSLAYLIPSLYYAIKHGEQIVVSTNTINLQEQLRQRDVPLLERVMPVPFRATVLKGRSHYLCLRKFEGKINAKDFEINRDDILTAVQMTAWLAETETGEDEELNFAGRGQDFWQTVASDADSCLNRACPWFRRCFYHRARHRAQTADLIITNHSLLFTDVIAEHRILPSYHRLVIDEAHQLEEAASRHLGASVHYFTLTNILARLYRDARGGLLVLLEHLLKSSGIQDWEPLAGRLQGLQPKLAEIREMWEQWNDWMYHTFMSPLERSANGEGGALVLRLRKEAPPRHWEQAQQMEDNFYVAVSDVLKTLEPVFAQLKEDDRADMIQDALVDLGGLVKQLGQVRDQVRAFVRFHGEDTVYWLEASAYYKGKSLQMNCVPVDVSALMRDAFFEHKESIVLTSATLSVKGSFSYFTDQLGLAESAESGRLIVHQLESPFQYRDNVLLCIPRDFPKVSGSELSAPYLDKLAESLAEVAAALDGRLLALFTSYRMLREVHIRLKDTYAAAADLQVLGQGMESGNRTKLVRQFLSHPRGILLGTSSFWEGVDIPGRDLTGLAIVRLPFQPPNHPLFEARSEYMKARNKNPFMQYAVPQAVIRFKQGFGRLIRTADDYGVVIVYDTRVIDTQYGKQFLYSLPGPRMEHMSSEQLVPRIKAWLEEREKR